MLDRGNVDLDESHGMSGCFSEVKKNKIGLSLFIRALDLFTRVRDARDFSSALSMR